MLNKIAIADSSGGIHRIDPGSWGGTNSSCYKPSMTPKAVAVSVCKYEAEYLRLPRV